MCDSAEHNWAWTIRRRGSSEPVASAEGYAYAFADESEARAMIERLGDADLDAVAVRDPGA